MGTQPISRRDFVGMVGATAGVVALGARRAAPAAVAANDKVRLGLIGAGSRGQQLLGTFLARPEVDFVAIADVDDHHAAKAAETIRSARGHAPTTTRDYREVLDAPDVDAVVIATPDHWHVIPAIHACQAGKDVYLEKPVGHNVAEGQALIRAARKSGKLVAVGTQQRSAPHFQQAVEAVRTGRIGTVSWVQTWNFENISPRGMGAQPDEPVPPGVDYDRWLGPAPLRPFNRNRFHLLFRWFFDYAGGMMGDWGVHLNDIVLWALDQPAPRAVVASGGIFSTRDNRDTPDTLQVVYDFPGCTLTYSMRKGNGLPLNGHPYGILFCGTDGSLLLDRAGYEIIPDTVVDPYGIRSVYGDRPLRTIDLKPAQVGDGTDGQTPHIANFLECLRTRAKPSCDIEDGHRSTNTCHLGNIAYKLGRKLSWDAETETFKNDPEANALLGRAYRKGYELPQV